MDGMLASVGEWHSNMGGMFLLLLLLLLKCDPEEQNAECVPLKQK